MTPWRLYSNVDHDLVLGTLWLSGVQDIQLMNEGIVQIPMVRFAPTLWGEPVAPSADVRSITLALKIYQDRNILVMSGASVLEIDRFVKNGDPEIEDVKR